jgi:hypothetical protein
MTFRTVTPRVLPADAVRVPVHAPGYRPSFAFGALVVVAAVPLVIAVLAADPGFRLVMAALGLLILLVIPYAVAWVRALPAGAIRVDSASAGLRFAPSSSLAATAAVVAVAGMLVGALPYVLDAFGLPATLGAGVTRLGPAVLGVLALAWLGYQVWGLRDPAGLTLTPEGVRGVRGSGHVDLPWSDLERVDVTAVRGARLVLHARGGAAVAIDPHRLGSDPNLVAAIVEHFRTHPGDRGALAEGIAALARVEDAVDR